MWPLSIPDLIDNQQCIGREAEVRTRIAALQEQWQALVAKSAEKTQKLREANQQQRFNEGIKELDFWLEEMEAKMESEEVGKDLSSVEALMKKHQQLEADMKAHEVREQEAGKQTDRHWHLLFFLMQVHIQDLNTQTLKFVEEHHFDAESIQAKQSSIDTRYNR